MPIIAKNNVKPLLSDYSQPGISLELAKHRKAIIDNLKYALSFNLPQDRSKAIEAEEIISFNLKKRDNILLDFREDKDKIKAIRINGKNIDCIFTNEHIVLPSKHLHKGNNNIYISFIAGEQSLNRRDEYLYTLFVPDRARTVFPCMDQPNLKAKYTLTLDLPHHWQAISNTNIISTTDSADRKKINFATTEPLSTYLFAFAAGKFEYTQYTDNNRTIGVYHRESDPKRIAQLPDIQKQVIYSLNWLEDYTGIKYPFAKYDLVILPGFQFGGMEHTGATFYNDNTIFLSDNPTPDEILNRTQLIAHETAHMWFGDFVTMDWFNDVWTKEVFANYFAAEITAPLFPDINHNLNWLRTYTSPALSEDRTKGGTAIRQPLDNMNNAGLIYNNIIYDKAPIMMRKLVEIMGKDAFRKGINDYLSKYGYSNATWDDLISILDRYSQTDLKNFSQVWVNSKGMPTINTTIKKENGKCYLETIQSDPYNRGLKWPQSFSTTLYTAERDTTIQICMNNNASSSKISLPYYWHNSNIKPDSDGKGYGLFTLEERQLTTLLNHWQESKDETEKQSLLIQLNENYLAGKINDSIWCYALISGIKNETNPLTALTLCNYLSFPIRNIKGTLRDDIEKQLYVLSQSHNIPSCRTQLMRTLTYNAVSTEITDSIYNLWKKGDNALLSPNDYTNMSYELAVRMPQKAHEILTAQRKRITNADRLQQFDFISPSTLSDTCKLDSIFNSLRIPQNRRIEPWTGTVLYYLNHPLREAQSVKYILPGLRLLKQVQQTGDIFFPGRWCNSLLGSHRSIAAANAVNEFLNQEKDYPQLLKNKILVAAFSLFWDKE